MRRLLDGEKSPLDVEVVEACVVADEPDQISGVVSRWCQPDQAVDLVVTSGGTGFAPRDVTPESIRPLLHKEAPGLVFGLLAAGVQKTPMAILSRPVCGVRHNTLIITLPGSPKAVAEGLHALFPVLPHTIKLLRDVKDPHPPMQKKPAQPQQQQQQQQQQQGATASELSLRPPPADIGGHTC